MNAAHLHCRCYTSQQNLVYRVGNIFGITLKKLHCFRFVQGDLHSYVRVRKRLREPEAKRLFRQMCEVVKRCHEEGIVLRDLKLRKFVFADEERYVNAHDFYIFFLHFFLQQF